jgi:hypothetical protein
MTIINSFMSDEFCELFLSFYFLTSKALFFYLEDISFSTKISLEDYSSCILLSF